MNPVHVYKTIALVAACFALMVPQISLSAEAPVIRAKKVHKVSPISSTQKGAYSGKYILHQQVPSNIVTVGFQQVQKYSSRLQGGAAALTSNNKSAFIPIWHQ